MKKINYLGWGLNLSGRHIMGVYHHRTLYTWLYAEQLKPARDW